MLYKYDDGGRKEAGFKGQARDCVARSIAIVSGLPYREIYNSLAELNGQQRKTNGKRPVKSARHGITTQRVWFKRYMQNLGFTWYPTMKVGMGCQVHLDARELPTGLIIVSVSKHYTAVINHVIHDTHDPSREGTRCVYGYWKIEG